MYSKFSDMYNIESLQIQNIDYDVVKKLFKEGQNGINSDYSKAEKFQNLVLSGYLDKKTPFIVCNTTKNGFYLITEKFSVQLSKDNAIIDNETGDYINNTELYLSSKSSFSYEAMRSRKVSINKTDENSPEMSTSRISTAIATGYLIDAYDSLKANEGMKKISKTSAIFNKDEWFFIRKNFSPDYDTNMDLSFVYESYDNYKNGDQPAVIVGKLEYKTGGNRKERFVNFVQNNNGNYEKLSPKLKMLSYQIDSYEEYVEIMSTQGLLPVPLSDLFRIVTTKGLAVPPLTNAIDYIMSLNNLCASKGVGLISQEATIDGINISINSEVNKYSHNL